MHRAGHRAIEVAVDRVNRTEAAGGIEELAGWIDLQGTQHQG
jgi:hypothetical protein